MEVLRAAREVFAFNGPELVPEKQTDGPSSLPPPRSLRASGWRPCESRGPVARVAGVAWVRACARADGELEGATGEREARVT